MFVDVTVKNASDRRILIFTTGCKLVFEEEKTGRLCVASSNTSQYLSEHVPEDYTIESGIETGKPFWSSKTASGGLGYYGLVFEPDEEKELRIGFFAESQYVDGQKLFLHVDWLGTDLTSPETVLIPLK